MNDTIKKELEELKEYCYKYIEIEYGKRQNYIRKTKITKTGLFIYGHKVYAPILSNYYTIYTYIGWYDNNNYEHIHNLLDTFVLDCQRLKESD